MGFFWFFLLSTIPETEEREEGVAWGNYKSLPRNEAGTGIGSGPKQVTPGWMLYLLNDFYLLLQPPCGKLNIRMTFFAPRVFLMFR